MRSCFTAIGALTMAALLVACTPMPPAAETPPLEGTAWVLSALPGAELTAGASATLRFELDRATGSDGCNRFAVGYAAQGGALEVRAARGVSTRMACPPAVMQQADSFMAALAGAKTYRVLGQHLELLAADGRLLVTLAAQSQALAGTGWGATVINNGKGAVASLLAGSSVSLEFAADGQAGGSAGCNRYTARYEQDGAQLRFHAVAATRRVCPGDDLMAQEQAYLQALESVATMRVEGQRLELRTAVGALAAALLRQGGH